MAKIRWLSAKRCRSVCSITSPYSVKATMAKGRAVEVIASDAKNAAYVWMTRPASLIPSVLVSGLDNLMETATRHCRISASGRRFDFGRDDANWTCHTCINRKRNPMTRRSVNMETEGCVRRSRRRFVPVIAEQDSETRIFDLSL